MKTQTRLGSKFILAGMKEIQVMKRSLRKQNNPVEIKPFIRLWLLNGIMRSKGKSVVQLWRSSTDRAVVKANMSLIRFWLLLRLMRYDDKTTTNVRRATDELVSF